MRNYDKIAFFYEYLMSHVNYSYWVSYIGKILKYYNFSPDGLNVLECACGTSSFLELWKKKYKGDYIGIDLSYQMLQQGIKRCSSLVQADMKTLPFKAHFNLILSLFDSVNYLMTYEELLSFLNCTNSVLEKNGLLIFDVTTVYNSLTHFRQNCYFDHYGDTAFEHKVYFDSDNNIQCNDFKYVYKGKSVVEKHRQKVYEYDELIGLINQTDFRLLGAYKNFTLKDVDNNTERIHFVLKK